MVFPQLQNTVPDASAEGAEVAGIGLERDIRELVNNAVEAFFEKRQHLALAAAVLIGGYHIVFRL